MYVLEYVIQKIYQFGTIKSYFIYFITLLYNIFNINSFILAFNTIK